MKTLLILRHAKTERENPLGDHARELTGRGRRDTQAVGKHLHGTIGSPDAIVTSDARRALQTAELVAAACGFTRPLTLEPRIYAAEPDTLLQVVRDMPETAACVVLVGHNPGLELLSAILAESAGAVRLPTAALAHLEFDIASWRDVGPGKGRWKNLTTPADLA